MSRTLTPRPAIARGAPPAARAALTGGPLPRSLTVVVLLGIVLARRRGRAAR
jgi:hypothetical protein